MAREERREAVTESRADALVRKSNMLFARLEELRKQPMKKRLTLGFGLLYEADIETDLRVALNEIRREQGLTPVYFSI